jgi:hypothetical protein
MPCLRSRRIGASPQAIPQPAPAMGCLLPRSRVARGLAPDPAGCPEPLADMSACRDGGGRPGAMFRDMRHEPGVRKDDRDWPPAGNSHGHPAWRSPGHPWSSRRPLTQQHNEAVSDPGSTTGASARCQARSGTVRREEPESWWTACRRSPFARFGLVMARPRGHPVQAEQPVRVRAAVVPRPSLARACPVQSCRQSVFARQRPGAWLPRPGLHNRDGRSGSSLR